MPTRCKTHKPPRLAGAGIKQHHPAPLDQWYANRRWRALRLLYLKANPLCADPLGYHQGCAVPAAEVHHICGRKAEPDSAYEWGNLQGLCKACHTRITNRERNDKEVDV